ncbi:hypothetical protein [Ruminiclostridium cellobioparum]
MIPISKIIEASLIEYLNSHNPNKK